MRDSRKIVIVGGGVAGLTLACKLSRGGDRVLVVEKEGRVGGLARSFSQEGFTFDVGPHRFHSDDPEVLGFVRQVLGDDLLLIDRRSGVRMFDRYFEWPLTISALLRMPPGVLLSAALDLFRKSPGKERSFEEYILGKYGKTLYELFFRPYTEKFLGIGCRDISRDWAITGIDRAVIDRKLPMNDLLSLAKSILFSEPPLEFIYPASGGISVFCEKLASEVVANGGELRLNARVQEVISSGKRIGKVVIDGEESACDLLVWTAPITEIDRLLGGGGADLEYLDLILYNYRVGYPVPLDYQWCYFGAAEVPFNRVSIPARFNPSLAPPGQAGLCVEVTCRHHEARWQEPEKDEPAIRRGLAAAGILRGVEAIPFSIEKVRGAYPVYSLDYREKVERTVARVGRMENLKLLGRSGSFWYNNMDHSILEALNLYRELKGEQSAQRRKAAASVMEEEGVASMLAGDSGRIAANQLA